MQEARTDGPLKLAVIVGSARAGRFGPTVADWFVAQARTRADMDVRVVDVADTVLPHSLGAPTAPAHEDAVRDATAALGEADAFAVITPEYNHSYPGALKNLIDSHFTQWQAKPVGFVSYGGMSGGLRAVEHLRAVFAELHATTVRDTVSLHDPWEWAEQDAGRDAAAKAVLDQLAWWGTALRAARLARPYGA
ncbi:NADPH-dependent FMN reductase [Actinomadura parmotrematis]|uniref:NAD(P)H-dependent oxidoreductase n=1 Tax=Actinomadura parmotrematis TaxID=2864039 RepID=A0ABS7FN34_9ACTN|nr:NAD(P)H-dependent oxidoreductase [Actinomadura parmotrematis]MBW8481798.1 NAD(P)H-dependent oxidoreductase [Actinomadura parmotrematis]